MLTAIKGYYDNGHITLLEQPPTHTKTEVIVTFLCDEKKENQLSGKRTLGRLKGKISISEDFNEPLEDFKDYM